MPTIKDYRNIFFVASLLGSLALASPVISLILPPRAKERFSEIHMLGSGRMAEKYPFNVKSSETYRLILGVGNHMGSSSYYAIHVKIRDHGERPPNVSENDPSPSPTVCEYRVFVANDEIIEKSINFSLNFYLLSNDKCCIIKSLTINDVVFDVNKTVEWDSEKEGFFINLFFELWIYDLKIEDFFFHNRFVGIWLNMTDAM